MLGRCGEAVAEFQTALAIDPGNLDSLINLGLAQRAPGHLDTTKETLLRALNIAPQNAAAHYNLAQLYDQTNEAARAVEHYRRFSKTQAPSAPIGRRGSSPDRRAQPKPPSDHVRD